MARVAKHRHAVEGGYARGEETRARIVAAALKMFGDCGFDAASTRDIATSAGVNAPALQYYFDNKEGVYLACVEHIVKRVWDYVSDVAADAERALGENADDAELIEAFCAIQVQLAQCMFTMQDADDWRLFMARLQSGEGPPAGFQFIYQQVSGRLSKVLAGIVGRLLGRPADDEETLIRTMIVSSQAHVLQGARRSLLTKLNWDKIDERRLDLLKRVISEHSRVLLRTMAKARDSGCTVHSLHGKRPASRTRRKRVAAGRA
jgi:TetR/AcrR family transcriptional regulator, regulator of cefoperazone and chloramphenicol sensitivity